MLEGCHKTKTPNLLTSSKKAKAGVHDCLHSGSLFACMTDQGEVPAIYEAVVSICGYWLPKHTGAVATACTTLTCQVPGPTREPLVLTKIPRLPSE